MFILYISYVIQFFMPMGALGSYTQQMLDSLVKLQSLATLLTPDDLNLEFTSNQRERTCPDGSKLQLQQLTVDNVAFKYKNSDAKESKTFQYDLACRRGTMTLIRGRSGSGKTTLADLILQHYEPDKGAIYVSTKSDYQVIFLGKISRIEKK